MKHLINYKNWSFSQNEKGSWFANNDDYDLKNESFSEAEVIDIVKDNKPIMHKHFPMHGFHS